MQGSTTSARRANPAGGAPKRRLILLLLIAGLAAWPVREALFRFDAVYSAVDVASTQLPWSKALDLPPGTAPANGDLADQARQFYPFYRWVSESWRNGDAPTWNPLIYVGAPGIANAQSGALDPQVWLLIALDALGGERLFNWGFAFTAWLRYFLALSGAYALARRLAFTRAASLLCGVVFAFSGYQVLWLNHALGHVPPFLPWALYFLEGLRGSAGQPQARAQARAMAGAALAMACAVLGGHAETAFYVGFAAGLWALVLGSEDRRAGVCALIALAVGSLIGAASLLPLTEYLNHSAAQVVRASEAAEARVEFVALGLLLAVWGLGAGVRRLLAGSASPGPQPSLAPTLPGESPPEDLAAEGAVSETTEETRAPTGRSVRAWLPAAIGLALAVAGAAELLSRRGLGLHALLALVPDRLGAPGTGGYRGEFNYIELASGWIAFVGLAFATAGALVPGGGASRRFGGRLFALVLGLGAGSFLLTIQTPGLIELYRFVPLVGLGATVRLAAVGSLMLGLLAAHGLDRAGAPSRWAGALILVPLVGAALVAPALPDFEEEVAVGAQLDERIGYVATPAEELEGENSWMEGWLHTDPRVDFGRVRVQRVGPDGHPVDDGSDLLLPLEIHPTPSDRALAQRADAVAAAPAGARWFRTPFFLTSLLPDGHWRFDAEFLAEGQVMASSRIGHARVLRGIDRRPKTLVFLVLGFLALVFARGRWVWIVPALAALHAFDFQRGVNPTVPASMVFPETATERILARELGPHRFFSDPEVLPANTGLVRGLRHVDGYDAMDPAVFNEFRLSILPDANPLLSWNPRGLDLSSGPFRLLGVKLLALREPIDAPGFELIAGPEGPEPAETWIYRALDPLPRAFCVPSVLSHDQFGELFRRDPSAYDPLGVAALKENWRPTTPFQTATVSEPVWTNSTVRLSAELDGDGLLVLTDQFFPGWKVFVDGEEREVLQADFTFRGVALAAGQHEIEFRYEPASLTLGVGLSVFGLLVLGVFLLRSLGPWRSRLVRGTKR